MADEFGQLRVPRVTTFWGKVDAVMIALKLKDRWNECGLLSCLC